MAQWCPCSQSRDLKTSGCGSQRWDQDQSPAPQPPGAASLLRDGLIGTRGPRPCLAGEDLEVVCKGFRSGTAHQGEGLEVGREVKEEEDLASPSGVLD